MYKNFHNNKHRNEQKKWNNRPRDDKPRRSIESILSCEYADYDDKQNQKDHNQSNDNEKQNKHEKWNNPLCKFIKSNKPYDRKEMLKAMIDKNGLLEMIEDIRHKKKNNNDKFYSYYLVRDIIFAAALPKAVDELYKKEIINKDDICVLTNELLPFLNNLYDQSVTNKYDNESIDHMRVAYTGIILKYNKKKFKKYMEIDSITESEANQLIIITASKNIRGTIYPLLRYLYNINKNTSVHLTSDVLEKIFKISYGKKSINEVVKYIMLEKQNTCNNYNPQYVVVDVNDELNTYMLSALSAMDKKQLEKTIKFFINERKIQEKDFKINRRFSKNNISKENYLKIFNVCDSMESEDFSISRFLK